MINNLILSSRKHKGVKTPLFADDVVLWLSTEKKENQFFVIMNKALNSLKMVTRKLHASQQRKNYQAFTILVKLVNLHLKIDDQETKASQELRR